MSDSLQSLFQPFHGTMKTPQLSLISLDFFFLESVSSMVGQVQPLSKHSFFHYLHIYKIIKTNLHFVRASYFLEKRRARFLYIKLQSWKYFSFLKLIFSNSILQLPVQKIFKNKSVPCAMMTRKFLLSKEKEIRITNIYWALILFWALYKYALI